MQGAQGKEFSLYKHRNLKLEAYSKVDYAGIKVTRKEILTFKFCTNVGEILVT